MTKLYFKYSQPATVTVTGNLEVPVGLLAPGKEKELKEFILIEGAVNYRDARQDIAFEEYPEVVEITFTEQRTLK